MMVKFKIRTGLKCKPRLMLVLSSDKSAKKRRYEFGLRK